MSHWTRRRNAAHRTPQSAVEWSTSATTTDLVRIIAQSAAHRSYDQDSPLSAFVEAAELELNARVPRTGKTRGHEGPGG